MSTELTLSVVNTDREMSSLPVLAPIILKFSEDVDVSGLSSIRVFRIGDRDGTKNLRLSYSDYLRYDESRFAKIKISKSKSGEIHVSPDDAWINNSDYVVLVGGGIRPTSTVLSDERIERYSTRANTILIDIKSYSETTKRIAASIKVGDKEFQTALYDITKEISIDGLTIKFKEGSVFAKERITIETKNNSIMVNDVIIKFSTVMAGVYGRPDRPSEVISKESIQNFFRNPLPGTTNHGGQQQQAPAPDNGIAASISVRLPNKIFIDLKEAISEDQIDIDSFKCDISEAFDNVNLENMGLYKEASYHGFVSLKKGGKRIQILFAETDAYSPGEVHFSME